MSRSRNGRFIGFDMGAETIRMAEVVLRNGFTSIHALEQIPHRGDVAGAIAQLLTLVDWSEIDGAGTTGRMSVTLNLPNIPRKASIIAGCGVLYPEFPDITVVSIGAQGFSVVEVSGDGTSYSRENGRCSQGTGSFLGQLIGRFDLDLAQADLLVADETQPAHLSGRCPVILKTDMTHLANRGLDRGPILAGLYDAVCDNVRTLIRPRTDKAHLVVIGGVARSSRVQQRFAKFAR